MNNRVIMDRARNRKGQYTRDRRMGPGPDRNRFHSPMDYDYARSGYNSGNDYNVSSDYRMSDSHMGGQYYGQPYRSNEYQGYAQGVVSYYPHKPDYGMDYHMEDEEYKKELHMWIEKLKHKDTFRVSKEQILRQAKSMGVKFDKLEIQAAIF